MDTFKFPYSTKQFIHGEYVESKSSEKITLRSAIDDSILIENIPLADAHDVDLAVESAEKALPIWRQTPPEKKSEILLRFADLILENAERLGQLETVVAGKGISGSGGWEPKNAADTFRYFAGFTDKFDGDALNTEDGFFKVVRHEPLGICAAINAFNSPMITFAMKAAPAVAVGNVLISKASEVNPLSSLYLGELAIQAGFPPGVLNVLLGATQAGVALSTHPKIRKISFTGSVAVGKKIQVAAAQSNLKRVTLELGGKGPVLIFPDADLPNAIANTASFLALNGQGCVLGTRIYVHESIADVYVGGLKAAVEGYGSTLGSNPLDPTTISSPLFHKRQQETVLRFLEQGKKEAELITGGGSWGDKGCYVQPTLFYKPKKDAIITTQEIFGPVAVIDTFRTEEEVLHKANDTEYGLGAYVYTKDLDRALRLATSLEAGTVAVNTAQATSPALPFGGYKGSGIGRENAKYVLHEYTQTKSIVIKFDKS